MVVAGDSMRPTLEPGWLLLATERGEPALGSVVVVERDGLELVKRVTAAGERTVSLQGDNPGASTDSRAFGPVPRDRVRGVVRAVYWPPSAMRLLSVVRFTG